MKTKTALLMLCLALSLSACKMLKTHIVKVTSSTEAQPNEVLLKTTKGYVYLSTQNMTDKQKHMPTTFHLDNQRQADLTFSVLSSHYIEVLEY